MKRGQRKNKVARFYPMSNMLKLFFRRPQPMNKAAVTFVAHDGARATEFAPTFDLNRRSMRAWRLAIIVLGA